MSDPKQNPMSKLEYRMKLSDSHRTFTREQCVTIHNEYKEGNVTMDELAKKYGSKKQPIVCAIKFSKKYLVIK